MRWLKNSVQAAHRIRFLQITRNEEKLLATMTDEQKELFSRYTDAVQEYRTMAECLLFQSSFKLGAKMMVEVMDDR